MVNTDDSSQTATTTTTTTPPHRQPLTSLVEPAVRVPVPLDDALVVVTLETVFTRRCVRVILQRCAVTTAPVPPAGFQIEDAVNGEFQRGGGSAWCVHFVHILQRLGPVFSSPFLSCSATLLAVKSEPGR